MTPEFSRPILIAGLGAHPTVRHIAAEPAERTALAERFGLIALDRLEADVTLTRERDGAIRCDAAIVAEFVQECVVTLEPLPARAEERFALVYRADIDEDAADRLTLEAPEDVVFEPLQGDAIDIGEAVAQQLAIGIDPFPRAPDAPSATEEAEPGPASRPERHNPFGALSALKRKD